MNIRPYKRSVRVCDDEIDLLQNQLNALMYEQDELDLEEGVLTIQTEITEEIWPNVIRPLHRMDDDDEIADITIFLSTPGGTLPCALAYCDVVDKLRAPTNIILFGEVLSCGVIMACAGFNNPNVHTYCYPSTLAMMHSPFVQGYRDERVTLDSMEELHGYLDRRIQYTRNYMLTHSNIPEDVFDNEMLLRDYYMDAEELFKFGIVD